MFIPDSDIFLHPEARDQKSTGFRFGIRNTGIQEAELMWIMILIEESVIFRFICKFWSSSLLLGLDPDPHSQTFTIKIVSIDDECWYF
jgi:hypothetical protein